MRQRKEIAMSGPRVAVVSAFEARLQPSLAASAAGALRSAGAQVTAWDADVWPGDFPDGEFDLVLISPRLIFKRRLTAAVVSDPIVFDLHSHPGVEIRKQIKCAGCPDSREVAGVEAKEIDTGLASKSHIGAHVQLGET